MDAPQIRIVEDTKAHYAIIRDLVDRAIRGMEPAPVVDRAWTNDDIDAVLDASEGRAPVLVIFDLEIIGRGNKAWMGPYIKKLWTRPAEQVRIIVWSALSRDLERLPERAHSRVLNKNDAGPGDPFGPLREAIEESVRSLASPA